MPTSIRPQKPRRISLSDRAGWLASILQEEFGVPFRIVGAVDGNSPTGVHPPGGAELSTEEGAWAVEFAASEQSCAVRLPGGSYRLAISIHDEGQPALVAIGLKASVARPQPDAIREETLRLEKWLRAVLDRLGPASRASCRHRDETVNLPPKSDAWEVIDRLERLMRSQKIHKDPAKNRSRVLRSAADLLGARSLIYVPARSDDRVACEGEPLLNPRECHQLASQLSESLDREEAGFCICNDPSTASWAARFPTIANLLALPVLDRGSVGWLIAINKDVHPCRSNDHPSDAAPGPSATPRGAPFRRTDAAGLAPFASLLGSHSRASQSYDHLQDLLVGLTRSLTAAIDAKDSYTQGHSERVARIAVEIGRELGLPEDELADIYLAGLLHDIGKIGIRDSVLGKRGPLDDEEYEHIKEYVRIGHRILSGLQAIAHLLPGVLHHHERYDGEGYPEGLKGKAIPLLGRILAVADSYDAMSTTRPYRSALPAERIEQIFVEGSGTQWEKAIVDAFVRCKPRVHALRPRGAGDPTSGELDGVPREGTREPLFAVKASRELRRHPSC